MATRSRVEVRLEHSSPGRVRVRVGKADRIEGAFERARGHLQSHPAVGSVIVNQRSGSVLVEGEDTSSLRGALSEVFDIVERSGEPGEAGVEAAVAIVKNLDARLGEATQGKLSLRWLVPTAFIAFGVRQLIREGPTIGAVPWYVLIYYGADAVLKLYPEHAPQPRARPAGRPRRGGIPQPQEEPPSASAGPTVVEERPQRVGTSQQRRPVVDEGRKQRGQPTE